MTKNFTHEKHFEMSHSKLREICEAFGVNMETAGLLNYSTGEERFTAARKIKEAYRFGNLHRIVDRLEEEPAEDAAEFIAIVDEAIKNNC